MSDVWAPVDRPEQLTVLQWNTPVASIPDPIIPAESESAPTSILFSEPFETEPVTQLEDDYYGWLDLTIEGLSEGQTVLVERFQVLKREGMADELALRQSFLVTDGALRPVGEGYNINMPNDVSSDDPSERDGRILAQLNFYEPSASTIVGDYLFRVSSPTSSGESPGYTPLEYPFSVVSYEADAPQGLVGRVLSAGEPVPGAFVVKVWQLSGYADLLSGTTTDENGAYRLPSEERNEFDFLAIKEGYVGNFGSGMAVNLEEDEFLTHDIELEKGTRTISGALKDAETGAPMAGVELFFLNTSDNGVFISQKFSVTWTDEMGHFSTDLTPDKWGIIVRPEVAYTMGYVTSAEAPLAIANLTSGDVSDLEVKLKRATSLIAGDLTNIYGYEIPGVKIMALNNETGDAVIGVTDGEGSYRLGVTPGRWDIFPFSFSLEDADHSGSITEVVDIPGDGQSILHSIEVRPMDAELFGTARDLDGNPIGRLRLRAMNTDLDNDETVIQYTFETDGEYNIYLPEGNWSVIPEPKDAAIRDEKLIFIDDIYVIVDPYEPGFDGEFEEDIWVIQVDESTPRILLTLTDKNTSEPVPNVYLHAQGTIDGTTLHSYAMTDDDGVANIPVIFEEDGTTEWRIHLSARTLQDVGKKPVSEMIFVTVDGPLAEVSATTEDFENPPLVGDIEISQFGIAGGLEFSSSAESGRTYHIEASEDLHTWRSMGRVRAVNEEVRLFDYSVSESERRFYRIVPATLFNPAE